MSVPTLTLLMYRKGTREMPYGVPKAVKTRAVVCGCFTSALLEKDHFNFLFFFFKSLQSFQETMGEKKMVLFWETLTKAFQVPCWFCITTSCNFMELLDF